MRVESGASSIQMLQAQRAFIPSINPSQEPKPTDLLGELAAINPMTSLPEEPLGLSPEGVSGSGLPIEEIKSIASQAGYVGLTDSDIQRAYLYGESLMTDYSA